MNNYKTRITFLFFGFFFSMVFCTYAQIPGHTNFPPTGIKSSVNKYKYIDYSFKLNQAKGNEPIEKRWIYKFSDSDFKKLKNSNQKLYDYYSTASNYFQNLSDKVKSIYTLEELWYIYMYDQPLKNKLATIK